MYGDSKLPQETKTPPPERRERTPKRRKVRERRQDMKIITSVSEGDIYLWAISLALMLGVLTVFVLCAIFIGGL